MDTGCKFRDLEPRRTQHPVSRMTGYHRDPVSPFPTAGAHCPLGKADRGPGRSETRTEKLQFLPLVQHVLFLTQRQRPSPSPCQRRTRTAHRRPGAVSRAGHSLRAPWGQSQQRPRPSRDQLAAWELQTPPQNLNHSLVSVQTPQEPRPWHAPWKDKSFHRVWARVPPAPSQEPTSATLHFKPQDRLQQQPKARGGLKSPCPFPGLREPAAAHGRGDTAVTTTARSSDVQPRAARTFQTCDTGCSVGATDLFP